MCHVCESSFETCLLVQCCWFGAAGLHSHCGFYDAYVQPRNRFMVHFALWPSTPPSALFVRLAFLYRFYHTISERAMVTAVRPRCVFLASTATVGLRLCGVLFQTLGLTLPYSTLSFFYSHKAIRTRLLYSYTLEGTQTLHPRQRHRQNRRLQQ